MDKPMEDTEQPNVSPQEQAMYDTVVLNARGIIFGDKNETVVKKLEEAGENVAESVGHTAAMILRSIAGGIEKKGRQVPKEVLVSAMDDVISDLIDVATAAKITTAKEEGKVAEGALKSGVKLLAGPAPKAPPKGIMANARGA